ncbi:hypothetical protein ILUMI_10512, partial [Ignelater luminosus]
MKIDINLQENQENISASSTKMASRKIFTLVFIKDNNKILLGHKSRGFGVNLWNGFGGKVEPKESILEGAKRELKEESNLDVVDLKHLGVVMYEVENKPENHIVHIFTANKFYGNIKCSEEMNPIVWYNYKDIPYQKMWPDTKFWYPIMLNDKYFSAVIKYNSDGKITEKDIKEYDNAQNFLKHISREMF